MIDAFLKFIHARRRTITEQRAHMLRDAQELLLDAELHAEHYAHTVSLLKARIKRLEKSK